LSYFLSSLTAKNEDYTDISKIKPDAEFYEYQQMLNADTKMVASHAVICKYIDEKGEDYRFEQSPHPIPELADRKKDNTDVGRFVKS
jgi:hypothetical protein